jgi:pimeloyl-ACP methyl ester carboxylesterase
VVVVVPPGTATDAVPLVLLSGGPGDTFMADIEDFLSILESPRPLIFIDQRGTGRSVPRLDCPELDGPVVEIFNAFLPDPASPLDTSCVESLPPPFAP